MENKTLTIDARMLFSSGIGTYLQNLLKRLRFESLGVKTHIYVYTAEEAAWVKEHYPEAKVTVMPVWIYGLKEQLYWKKHIRGGAFWAPHFNIPWGGYEKLIVTVHDCFPLTPIASPLMHAYGKVMYSRIRRKADAIITVSEFTRHELHERAKIFDTPTYVIPHGVDPTWFTAAKPQKPYPFKYLVFVGNLKPHKNLGKLLMAWKKLKPEHKLVCVGHYKKIKLRDEKAYRLLQEMKEEVIATDWIDDELVRAIVKNADGLVLPSLYEGFGMTPLEAMGAQVPTLVSDTASLPEVCGNCSLYCDPTSEEDIVRGLKELIALSGEKRRKLLEHASEHAATFHWDKSAQATMEVFKSVLG